MYPAHFLWLASCASKRPIHGTIITTTFLLLGFPPGTSRSMRRRLGFALFLADLCKNILGAVYRGPDAPWVSGADAQVGICILKAMLVSPVQLAASHIKLNNSAGSLPTIRGSHAVKSGLTSLIINPSRPGTISHQIQLLQTHQHTRNILPVTEIVCVHTNQSFLGGTLFGTRRHFGRDAEFVLERGMDDGRPDCVYVGGWDKEHPLWVRERSHFCQRNEE